MNYAGGRIVLALEGGYDLAAISDSAEECVKVNHLVFLPFVLGLIFEFSRTFNSVIKNFFFALLLFVRDLCSD